MSEMGFKPILKQILENMLRFLALFAAVVLADGAAIKPMKVANADAGKATTNDDHWEQWRIAFDNIGK